MSERGGRRFPRDNSWSEPDAPLRLIGDDERRTVFARQVRDALAHLYDPIYLQTHSLTRLVPPDPGARSPGIGRALRQVFVDAIEALRPLTIPAPSAASYQILRLRYVDGLDLADVQSRLALGRSEYYREQQRGIEALVSLLQSRVNGELAEPDQTPIVALATAADGAVPPHHNLPAPITSYIARAGELDQVERLLRECRLLTLTGAGGCGKTRLALEVARSVVGTYPDGVWLVELAPLADAALVPDAVAAVLGVRGSPIQLILATLLSALRGRRLLLILDNCEHLLDACARLTDAVLRSCPDVQILATSREALGITGEVSWLVPSLALPPVDQHTPLAVVAGSEAIRLFFDRTLAVQPALTLTEQNAPIVAHICRRLDGIPLAIELAATRVKTLSLEQIAARLDQRFRLLTVGSRTALPRQQTLAATVAWSYDLLTEPERVLFNRLSVFAGGFTLDAVEAVCGEAEDLLDVLSNLASKSLVVAESGAGGVERYHLLETLRQYGLERLALAGEEDLIHRRHAAYYLHLAEEAEPHLFRPEQLLYLARINLEWDNIRVAMRWYLEHGAADEGLRLAAALVFPIWYRGLDTTEGHVWRTKLLGLSSGDTPSAARVYVLLCAGSVAGAMGDMAGARRWLGEALAMARQVENARVIAWVMLRTSRFGGPDPERWYGSTDWELAEEALVRYRAAGDRWGIAMALAWLGNLAFRRGDSGHARVLFTESLATARSVGERHVGAFVLRYFGEAASTENDAEAAAYLTESVRLYRELGDQQGPAYDEYLLGRLDCLRQRYDSAREHFRIGLRFFKDWTWLEMIVRSLNGLAMVAAGQRHPERALHLAAASAHLAAAGSVEVSPIERAEVDQALVSIRQALSEQEAASATAAGQAMTLEEAVSYALGDGATC